MPILSIPGLVDASLRASVVIVLLLCVRRALRRWIGSRALAWLWLVVAARLLCPLPVSAPWYVPSLFSVSEPAAPSFLSWRVSVSPADSSPVPGVIPRPRPASLPPTTYRPGRFAALWLAGVLLAAGRLGRGWWLTRRWATRTLPADSRPGLQSIYLALPAELRRGVELRLTDTLDVPTLVGVLHPQIWLPRTLPDTLTSTELRHVLFHELGHARRRDLLAQWLCALACCLHWFNPLVWILARVARTDRELACDAWVLSHRAMAPEPVAAYGHTLVKVVAGICHGTARALPVVSMAAGKRHLGLRVREIRAFHPVAPWRGLVALAGMMALVAVCTFRGAAAQVDTSATNPAGVSPLSAQPEVSAPSSVLRPLQVQIEYKFIEITRSSVLELGNATSLSSPAPNVLQRIYASHQAQSTSTSPGIFYSSVILPVDFQLLMRELNKMKGVDLLSAPRVTTKSRQKATIEIVREFIYATAFEHGQDPAGQPWVKPTDFDKTNTGVTLEVTPTVSAKQDFIDLSVGWKVANFEGFVGTDGKPVPAQGMSTLPKFPVFDTHSVNTVVTLSSGATAVFSMDGGVYRPEKAFQTAADGEEHKPDPGNDVDRLLLIFVTATLVDVPSASKSYDNQEAAPSPSPAAGSSASPPAAGASRNPSSAEAKSPYGVPVPGKPGFVKSPYAPDAGYVDLHGFKPGQSVRDPYTGKMFLVP